MLQAAYAKFYVVNIEQVGSVDIGDCTESDTQHLLTGRGNGVSCVPSRAFFSYTILDADAGG